MGDLRISQLVERVTLQNNDVLPIVASGATTTNKVTLQTLSDFVSSTLDSVTSIGISMPAGFTVTGSPVTTSGTINITGAGTTLQYIDGTGALQTFPTISNASQLVTEVYNNSGSTITKGKVVYIIGGQGNLPTIALADSSVDATSAQTYGVVQTNISNMSNGYVVVIGRLGDLDTNAYANGTQLYLGATGNWTSTKPYAPTHIVYVGIVVRQHPTQGVVEIKIQNGYELDELHDVSAQTPADNDILQYNSSTSLWEKSAGTTTNIAEGTNLYYTDTRARNSITLTTNGTTGVATYSGGTLNIPNYKSIVNGIESGGVVTYSGTGLLFDISACVYYIGGIKYTTAATTITLTGADATNPRIDVIAVNTSSAVVLITGTPSVNPVEPQVDPLTQIQLTNVTVNAGATTPAVSNVLIYDENAASPTEWNKANSGFASVNYAYNVAPFQGSVSILATSTSNVDSNITFTSATTLDAKDYTAYKFAIKLSRALTGWERIIAIYAGNIYSGRVVYLNGPNWNQANVGFNYASTSWQLITITTASIGATSGTFTQCAFQWQGTATAINISFDRIEIQSLSNTGGGNTSSGVSIGDKVNNGTTGSVLFVGANSILQQDNAQLFWDDSNNRLGIGTATPSAQLQVYTTSASNRGIIVTQASNDVTASIFTGSKIRGTSGAVVNGDNLFNFNGQGWDGSAYQVGSAIRWIVDGVVSAGNVPTSIELRTGTNSLGTARLTISSAGVSTFTNNLFLSPIGSTTSVPRTFGIGTFAAGEAARWQFGDSLNSIQNSHSGRFILQSYWGVNIYGGRQNVTALGFELGLVTDWSLNIFGTQTANPVLVVTGATSQTGNLQEWRTSTNTILGAVTSGGALLVGGSTNSASAIVRLDSTSRGFLPPRMLSAQRTGIASPETGLMVFQTNGTEGIYIKNSTGWVTIGTGTVTDVSVVSANGFAGSVATQNTTPAITLSTTITGMLKGNGTAISAATDGIDYVSSNLYTADGFLTSNRTVNLVESNLFLGTASETANWVYVKKGVVPAIQVLTLAIDRTLTNQTTQQAFFTTGLNSLSVVANQTYFFEGLYYITTMSATSGNITLDMKGAGTATFASIMFATNGLDSTTPTTAGALSGGVSVTATFTAPVTAATGTGMFVSFKGTFRIAAGVSGTLIPSIALTTGVGTAVAKANSFFRMYSIADAVNSKTEI